MALIDTAGLATYDEEYVQPIMETIAPVERGSAASKAYSIGDQLFYGNLLYKAKTNIAQNDPFVVDTNIELVGSLTEQLANLGGGALVTLTSAQYNSLTPEQKADQTKIYFVPDAPSTQWQAFEIDYDNTTSGLTADTMQGAIDEVVGSRLESYMTAAQTAVADSTVSLTFVDSNIKTTSVIIPMSDPPAPYTSVTVSQNGTAVLAFPKVSQATSMRLIIINP